jgi:capsule polysaccharide export protein KpsE/RkpR
VRSALRQRLEERTKAIEIRERMYPQTSEYDRFHLEARLVARRFEAAVASFPRRPSMEKTSGVKVRSLAIQRAPYLSFFSFSCRSRTLDGADLRFEGWSVSVIRTSKIA